MNGETCCENYGQLLNPNGNVIQLAPVRPAMIFIIPKEKRIIKSPIIAHVAVFLAPSTCFGSPPEVMNLIPESIMKNTAAVPARISAQFTTFLKMIGRHWRVATPVGSTVLSRQESQGIELNIELD